MSDICYSLQMRRIFAILLMALLPVQFTWAAVTSYCGHESGAASQHFGHHEHQHNADAVAKKVDGSSASKTLGSDDLDCAHCHGSCAGMTCPPASLTSPTLASQPAALAQSVVRSMVHSPPERPQWALLA